MSDVDLEVRIEGQPGEITVDSFVKALNGVNELVAEVSRSVSGVTTRTVRAFISELRMSSLVAVMQLRPEPDAKRADPETTGLTLVRGLKVMERSDELPEGFNHKAIQRARSVSQAAVGGAAAIAVSVLDSGSGIPMPGESARVTPALADNVKAAEQGVATAIGGMVGVLDVLSARGGGWFGLREEIGNTAVRCRIPDVGSAKDLFLQRVYVHGLVTYNRHGQATRIEVEDLTPLLPPERQVRVSDIVGIDPGFTDGLDAVEYIRSLRD